MSIQKRHGVCAYLHDTEDAILNDEGDAVQLRPLSKGSQGSRQGVNAWWPSRWQFSSPPFTHTGHQPLTA